jgi:hypothetical protein
MEAAARFATHPLPFDHEHPCCSCKSRRPSLCSPALKHVQVEDMPGMQACNLFNLPENYTMKYCLSSTSAMRD